MTEAWDVKTVKLVWREEGTLEAADDTHAYWFTTSDTIARRTLDGKSQVEQLFLPKDVIRLDVQPPKLFALVKHDKDVVKQLSERVLTRFDLKTGEQIEYDLRVDGRHVVVGGGSGSSRYVTVRLDDLNLPLGLDASTGDARTIHDKVVYRIPQSKEIPATEKPMWGPLAEPK